MNRRALTRAQLIFVARMFGAAIVIATFVASSPTSTHAVLHDNTPTILPSTAANFAATEETPPDTDEPQPTRPPITVNEYFPEDRNVTDCIGALERPGCGSKNRGGWGQYAVAGALALGMAVIFGNIIRGVRRNERARNLE